MQIFSINSSTDRVPSRYAVIGPHVTGAASGEYLIPLEQLNDTYSAFKAAEFFLELRGERSFLIGNWAQP